MAACAAKDSPNKKSGEHALSVSDWEAVRVPGTDIVLLTYGGGVICPSAFEEIKAYFDKNRSWRSLQNPCSFPYAVADGRTDSRTVSEKAPLLSKRASHGNGSDDVSSSQDGKAASGEHALSVSDWEAVRVPGTQKPLLCICFAVSSGSLVTVIFTCSRLRSSPDIPIRENVMFTFKGQTSSE